MATSDSSTGCGKRKSAALRYELCLLRYSDQPFFGAVERRILVYSGWDANNASQILSFQIDNLIKDGLIDLASSVGIKFAVGNSSHEGDSQKVYAMAWCSMDLERTGDCAKCLGAAMDGMVPGKERGRVAAVSCEVRFETSQFFSGVILASDPQAQPPEPPETAAPTGLPVKDKGERNSTTKPTAAASRATAAASGAVVAAAASGAAALLLFVAIFALLILRWKRRTATTKTGILGQNGADENKLLKTAVQMFDFDIIKTATNNFAHGNKLGQGGFGAVYKGMLQGEQEIAVKRLSTTSGQGLEEMKNEIDFIGRLQHKNLVRLLGYCLEGNEKLLVYEFLPNTSLDKFISDPNRRKRLDWRTRVKIIVGIARGIRYLHEDSRLKIVHRDLKASNILLDGNMNPKISDFGLAKLFGNDETERNTNQIAGTFGYMAPEYVLHGIFSTKSDVFSYGVLVLEIVTGEKESAYREESSECGDRLSYVWKHWIEGKAIELVDKSLADKYSPQEALRSIQIGLLCVQQEQMQRPTMTSVTAMLSSLTTELPNPSPPAFYGAEVNHS